MQKIPTAVAAEGMVLAQEIPLEGDRILCGKGTVLSESLIERLKRMEISHITVEGHPVALDGEKTLETELQELDARFSRVMAIPPLVYLKDRIRARIVASWGGAQNG